MTHLESLPNDYSWVKPLSKDGAPGKHCSANFCPACDRERYHTFTQVDPKCSDWRTRRNTAEC